MGIRCGSESALVLACDLEVDVEEGRVLQGHCIVEDNGKQEDQNEEPVGAHAVLVGCHEVASEVHRLQVKHRQRVDHRDLSVPEVGQLVAPDLPDDHAHELQHHDVADHQRPQVARRDANDLEDQGDTARDGRELDEHGHVHDDQEGVKELCALVVGTHLGRVNIRVVSQQRVDVVAAAQDDEVYEVTDVQDRDECVSDDGRDLLHAKLPTLTAVATPEADPAGVAGVVELLLAEVQGVENQLDDVEDEERVGFRVHRLSRRLQRFRVSCRLVDVQSEGLEVGDGPAKHLFSLDAVLVEHLHVGPPVGSRRIQGHLEIDTSGGVAEESVEVGIDLLLEALGPSLAWVDVDDVATTRERRLLTRHLSIVPSQLTVLMSNAIDPVLGSEGLGGHFLVVALLVVTHNLAALWQRFRVLGSKPHWPYDTLLLLDVLTFGEEELRKVVLEVVVEVLLVSDGHRLQRLRVVTPQGRGCSVFSISPRSRHIPWSPHLVEGLDDFPEEVLLDVVVLELLTDDVDGQQSRSAQEPPDVDGGLLVAARERSIPLEFARVIVGLVRLEPDDILGDVINVDLERLLVWLVALLVLLVAVLLLVVVLDLDTLQLQLMQVSLVLVDLHQEDTGVNICVEWLVACRLLEEVLDGVLVGGHDVEVLVGDHEVLGVLTCFTKRIVVSSTSTTQPVLPGRQLEIVEGGILVEFEGGDMGVLIDVLPLKLGQLFRPPVSLFLPLFLAYVLVFQLLPLRHEQLSTRDVAHRDSLLLCRWDCDTREDLGVAFDVVEGLTKPKLGDLVQDGDGQWILFVLDLQLLVVDLLITLSFLVVDVDIDVPQHLVGLDLVRRGHLLIGPLLVLQLLLVEHLPLSDLIDALDVLHLLVDLPVDLVQVTHFLTDLLL